MKHINEEISSENTNEVYKNSPSKLTIISERIVKEENQISSISLRNQSNEEEKFDEEDEEDEEELE